MNRSLCRQLVAAVIGSCIASASAAAGIIGLTNLGAPYTQDFNTLAASGTSMVMPTGWDFVESDTNANTSYTAGSGSSNAGDTYSFGGGADSERALGGLRSGTLVPLFGAYFSNGTGATITSLEIAYTGEQWRLGQNTTGRAADRLDFQFSLDANALGNGTWTDFDALDFSSPATSGTVGALNGNDAANRAARSFTIGGLSIANGATFWMRWADVDLDPGADDGLGIDDFAVTARGTTTGTVPEPGTLALLGLGLAGLAAARRRDR